MSTAIEVSNEMKKAKYAPIVEEARQKDWVVQIWAVEVGCRGFPARSVGRTAKRPGIYRKRERKDLLRKIGEVAEEASMSIWRWCAIKEWGKDRPN